MSIHPEYAEAILSGAKRAEFRKRPLAPDVETVVVYSTAPVQRVVGAFTIGRTVVGDPDAVWEQVGSAGAISRATYDRYFAGAPRAVALVVENVQRWAPTPLAAIHPRLTPPQSFVYIPEHLVLPAPAPEPAGACSPVRRRALRRAVGAVAALRLRPLD